VIGINDPSSVRFALHTGTCVAHCLEPAHRSLGKFLRRIGIVPKVEVDRVTPVIGRSNLGNRPVDIANRGNGVVSPSPFRRSHRS